ncbi:TadE/TadG family type IV pilus assembly protein [Aromatoleum bremense]|nr:TadE/TadG family type IV pilus assembly protein [Aromatoleum bremense]
MARFGKRQRGVAAVEFALVAGVFFSLLIGIMEMGRVLFYWNTSVEATRLGARTAVVCDIDDGVIKAKMNAFFPVIPIGAINVSYTPPGCTADTCSEATVSVSGITVNTVIPYIPLTLTMPGFATTLTRESMSSAGNPVCS